MYVGKVIIDEESPGNGKNIKVRVNKKLFGIKINTATEDNKLLLEELYPYVVKCYESDETKAYKVLKETNEDGVFYSKVLFLMRSEDSEEVYDVSIEEAEDYPTHDLRLESFFGGEYRLELEEDVEVLLKRYDPIGNGRLYALVGVVALVSIFGISIYMYVSSVKEQRLIDEAAALHAKKERQAVVIPLTPVEISRLKTAISLDLIDMVLFKAKELSESDKLTGHSSIRSFSATYEVGQDKVLLRGAVGYEYDYPVQGTVLLSDGIYSKRENYTIQKNRQNLVGDIKTGMSIACVRATMEIPSESAVVVERTSELIKVKYTKMKPSALIGKLLPLIQQCPAYIDMIGMSDDKFDLVTILYTGGDQ